VLSGRYFSEVELKELFALDVSRLAYSHTAQELHKHHATDRAYDADIAAHVASLATLEYCVDTSDHSVLFSRVDESASGALPAVDRATASQAQLCSNAISSLRFTTSCSPEEPCVCCSQHYCKGMHHVQRQEFSM
jgi:hypothetical protein